jgi:hypothetical protein
MASQDVSGNFFTFLLLCLNAYIIPKQSTQTSDPALGLERFPFNSSLHPYSLVIPAKAGIDKRLLDATLE